MAARIWAIASSVVADAVRRKIVYAVLLFGVVLAAAIPLLPSYGVGVVEAVFREVSLTLMYVAAIVITLALAANRVPGEVERRTVYNVLSRDVRRWEYIAGTWLGITLVMAGVLAAFTCMVIGIGWLVYGAPMWQLWEGALGILMEAGVLAAFCMAISAAAGPVIVATAALAFLFIAHARSGLLAPDQLAYKIYPSLDPFNVINPVAHGSGLSMGALAGMLLAFVAWSALLLVISSVIFGRRDL